MIPLYLASSSASRGQLLLEAKIPFFYGSQSADESDADWSLPLPELVMAIARQKMVHAVLPAAAPGDRCLVLTADTLGVDALGVVHGKPVDKVDAIKKLMAFRGGATTGTAFCLELRRWVDGAWRAEKRVEGYSCATYIFDVPDHLVDFYLDNLPLPYTSYSGGVTIEGLGAQFLKTIDGSYSAVMGLPIFEVRQALQEMGFFDE